MSEENKNGQEPELNEAAEDQAPEAAAEGAAETAAEEAAGSEEDVLAKLQAENGELKDRLMRALAEVENVRRRAEKERQDQTKFGVSPLAKELMPVVDNLARALEHLPDSLKDGDDQVKNFLMGIEMTEKQLVDAFGKCQIQKIDPLGEKFDYKLHQAMSEATGTDQEPGTIVQVLQSGYVLHERLLRPAMVIVAKGEPQAPSGDTEPVDTTA